jgi:hypothetical protein
MKLRDGPRAQSDPLGDAPGIVELRDVVGVRRELHRLGRTASNASLLHGENIGLSVNAQDYNTRVNLQVCAAYSGGVFRAKFEAVAT